MQGYEANRYGDSFSDEEFEAVAAEVPEREEAVQFLAEQAGNGGALELGIGQGRLALPLAELGVPVHGIEVSTRMVTALERRREGLPVTVEQGDLGRFSSGTNRYRLIYCAWNTFFSLTTEAAQRRCFQNVAAMLDTDGRFTVEAFVPDTSRFDQGQELRVRSLTVNSVTLQASLHDEEAQTVRSQQVVLAADGVRLHPHVIRYAWPEELDAMAAAAGLRTHERWAGWRRQRFTDESTRHVSVYGPVQ